MKKHFYLFILTLSDDFQQLINLDNWFLNRLALNLNFYIVGLHSASDLNQNISIIRYRWKVSLRPLILEIGQSFGDLKTDFLWKNNILIHFWTME